MPSDRFFCQAAWHEPNNPSSPGYSRLVPHPNDRIIVTLDFMRFDGKNRLHRVRLEEAFTWLGVPMGPYHLCLTCANEWREKMRQAEGEQETLL